MATEHDDPERSSQDAGDSAPDWTTWLRSRLERVASSERKGASAPGQDAPAGDPSQEAGAGSTGEPALPRFEDAETGELGLRLDWPDHPLQPSRREGGPDVVRFRPDPATVEPDRQGADPVPSEEARPGVTRFQPVVPEVVPEEPVPAEPAQPGVAGGAGAAVEKPSPVTTVAQPPAARPTVDSGLESLKTAVTALSARVDLLIDNTASARSVLNERLDGYADVVSRLARSSATDLEEYRRMHVADFTELRRTGAEMAETLRRIAAMVEDGAAGSPEEEDEALTHRLDRLEDMVRQAGDDVTALRNRSEAAAADGEPWAGAVRQLFEEVVAGQQDEVDDDALADVPERLDRLEGAMGQLVAELADLRDLLEKPAPPTSPDPALARLVAEVAELGTLLRSRDRDAAPAPPASRRPAPATPAPRPRRTTQIRATSPRGRTGP